MAAPKVTAAELVQRIDAAEARLLQHEQDVRGTWLALQQRVKEQRHPSRWAPPLAGAAATVGALWWFARRRPPPRRGFLRPREPRVDPVQRSARMALPLAELVTMAWPLLPPRWRPRVGPTTGALITAGLPMLRSYLRKLSGEQDDPDDARRRPRR